MPLQKQDQRGSEGFEDGRTGPWVKEHAQPLEAVEDEETHSPLEPQKDRIPAVTLIWAHWHPF